MNFLAFNNGFSFVPWYIDSLWFMVVVLDFWTFNKLLIAAYFWEISNVDTIWVCFSRNIILSIWREKIKSQMVLFRVCCWRSSGNIVMWLLCKAYLLTVVQVFFCTYILLDDAPPIAQFYWEWASACFFLVFLTPLLCGILILKFNHFRYFLLLVLSTKLLHLKRLLVFRWSSERAM